MGLWAITSQTVWVRGHFSGTVMSLALRLYLVLSFNQLERWCLKANFPRFWTPLHHGMGHDLVIRALRLLRLPVSIWELLNPMTFRMYLLFFFKFFYFEALWTPQPQLYYRLGTYWPWKAPLTSSSTAQLSEACLCYGWSLLGHDSHSYHRVHGLLFLNL